MNLICSKPLQVLAGSILLFITISTASAAKEPQDIFIAETVALKAMVSSVNSGITQIKSWGGLTNGMVRLSCPKLAEILARIAAGQIPLANADTETLIGIAGDLGHDVAFGMYNLHSKNQVKRRTVSQPIALSKGVTWNDIISTMNVSLKYMNERIRLNNKAFQF